MNRFCRGFCFVSLIGLLALQPAAVFAQDFGGEFEEQFEEQFGEQFGEDFDGGAAETSFILMVYAIVIVVAVVIGLAITVVVIIMINGPLNEIPPEHRLIEPGQVWLLLIPCFNVFWNFAVFQKVPKSFQSYFSSQGRTDVGDCGGQIGLWYAITVALSCVPCVNYIAGPASLVLLIIFLVKIHSLKGQIQQGTTQIYPN